MIRLLGETYYETSFCMDIISKYIYSKTGEKIKVGYPNLNIKSDREKFERMSTYALQHFNLL